MLARAIRSHDLSPWLLLLPMAFEVLLIFWIGWILSRFVVSCPAFRKSAGSFALVVFWSIAIIGAVFRIGILFLLGFFGFIIALVTGDW